MDEHDQTSLRLGEADIQVLASLLGRRILSVDSMTSAIVESAYLRLTDAIVELAALERGVDDRGFPWRISAQMWSTETVFDAPLLTYIPDVGTVRSIDVLSDEKDVEDGLAIRLTDGRTLWACCAGGDHVAPQLGDEPRGTFPNGWRATTKVSRSL